jgi:transposase
MDAACVHTDPALVELRQQAHYWRALHARAVERATRWEQRARELESTVRQQAKQITELTGQVEALKAKVVTLQHLVFGTKSDNAGHAADASGHPAQDRAEGQDQTPDPAQPKRRRGQQPGSKGHGRKRRPELETEVIAHELPPGEQCCPRCGKPFERFPGTDDSEEIDWQVRLVRRVHKRSRYRPTCSCDVAPGIVTAPGPAKLIPKGLFSTGFWTRLVMEKFLFHCPLHRVRRMLELQGLPVSQGTLTGGLKRIGEYLQPYYVRLLERSRNATHWFMDETRWMVLVDLAGKVGHRWWLWVVVTHHTCVFLLDPSRSAEVPKNHLGEQAQGILNVDRYSAYKALGKLIRLAFCWLHVRRDFVSIRDGYPKLRSWATEWVERINELFRINHERVECARDSDAFAAHDRALRERLEAMAQTRQAELANPTVHAAQAKALTSLGDHWEGLTVFVDHPEIPMDNNVSERALIGPALGRKNFYGSGSGWSGMLAAVVYSIFQTLLMNHIDPQKFLLAYFQACAENGGHAPDDVDAFLPWNLSEEQKEAWRYPRRPP